MTSNESTKIQIDDKNNTEDNEVDYSIITALFFLEIRIEERLKDLKTEKYVMNLSDTDEQD